MDEITYRKQSILKYSQVENYIWHKMYYFADAFFFFFSIMTFDMFCLIEVELNLYALQYVQRYQSKSAHTKK